MYKNNWKKINSNSFIDPRHFPPRRKYITRNYSKQLVNPYKFHNPINVFESLGTKALFTAAAAQLELVRVNEKDARGHSSRSHVERDFWDNASRNKGGRRAEVKFSSST